MITVIGFKHKIMQGNTILNEMGRTSGTYEKQKRYTQGFGGET
jgi:hypothetical protein